MRFVRVIARMVIALSALALPATATAQATQELEVRYLELERYSLSAPSPASKEEKPDLLAIRNFYLSKGDVAAEFLVSKVRSLNEEEARIGEEYHFYLVERNRSPMTKGRTCLILADLFNAASPYFKDEILKVLAEAFTPSERYFHSNPIEYALYRIGRPAIPVFLQLATHQAKVVRCRFAENLNSMLEESKASTKPPVLNCQATAAERDEALRQWAKWWKEYGAQVKVSEIPSLFELDVATEKAR